MLAAVTLGGVAAPALAQEPVGEEARYSHRVPLDEMTWFNPEPALTLPPATTTKLPPFFAGTRSDDIINIFYTEAKYTVPATTGYRLRLGEQYSDQRSTGANLLTGSSFSTRQWGLKADLSVVATKLTIAYTATGNGADMRSPWGAYPGYTSVQVEDFNRAGEDAWLLEALYDFSRHGAEGLTFYALAVFGNNVTAPYYNQNEYDLNLKWTPGKRLLKGASFRLRYARVDQRGGGDPGLNDFRFIAT